MTRPNFASQQLKQLIERIERLEAEKAAIAGDIREIYAEAKGHGFDTKIMRQAIRTRAIPKVERDEQAALLDLYLHALGMDREAEAPAPAPMLQAAE
ncbi:MAG: DUF2312 domain-containing protein [Alphaproteobacteria bacterium]|nr:DUF2312 domain-containing protein [Alphaproteobacteria bacterium]